MRLAIAISVLALVACGDDTSAADVPLALRNVELELHAPRFTGVAIASR